MNDDVLVMAINGLEATVSEMKKQIEELREEIKKPAKKGE